MTEIDDIVHERLIWVLEKRFESVKDHVKRQKVAEESAEGYKTSVEEVYKCDLDYF